MADWIKTIFSLSVDRLLLIFSCILLLISFDPIRYQNAKWEFVIKSQPNLLLFLSGSVLLLFFFWRNRPHTLKNASTEKIANGSRLQFSSNHSISVVTGKIEDFPGGDHSAVVLPANTSFDDQCINDNRSALGSFFLKHFPSGIPDIQNQIRQAAIEACGIDAHSLVKAPPGTTLMLDKPLGSSFRIMITAITSETSEHGITADTLSLISSVKQVFKLASQKRISSLTMPVMGTGHGGLDFKAALSLLLVQCMYSMQHEGSHHVQEAIIIIFDPDNRKKDLVATVVNAVSDLTQM